MVSWLFGKERKKEAASVSWLSGRRCKVSVVGPQAARLGGGEAGRQGAGV